MKKRVLIITYYWPPSGGAGVQRWLKFAKYLPEFGWQPVVYTPDNGEVPVTDESLDKDISPETIVIRKKIWEPYDWYKKFVGQKKDEKINVGFLSEQEKPKIIEKISVWIRGNLFIPDARKFWIKPSTKFLSKYLSNHKIDAIISTGPPHSMHLIALKLQNKFKIPWIADFRDPWTNIDFYDDLLLTKRSDKKHRRLEKSVLQMADCVLTVGKTLGDELKQLGAKKVEVITNGFDELDYQDKKIKPDKKFSIVHIGSMPKSRNPVSLWKVLSKLVKNNADFRNDLEVKLVGKCDFHLNQSISDFGLSNYVKKVDYVAHSTLGNIQKSAQVLLLLINNTQNAKGILTGKFFEYLAAKRPILAIGPIDGDVAKILKETHAGAIVDFNDFTTLEKIVNNYFEKYKKHQLFSESLDINRFKRKNLTKHLAGLMNAL
ncbi:MAG TPA: glycosyltransferase family 4 protein [Bacteroidales bacterium]|nr:glycosyltransferase family 4 protein [Bacteroidales bacterium]